MKHMYTHTILFTITLILATLSVSLFYGCSKDKIYYLSKDKAIRAAREYVLLEGETYRLNLTSSQAEN